jgi:hypothetical protein
MYLHKYKKGDKTFYHPTSGRAKPPEAVTLKVDDWVGVAPGGGLAGNALGDLEKVTFGKEEDVDESKKEEKKEEKKRAFWIPVAEHFRYMATQLQED